jgi:hypothetical protein
MSRPQPAAAEGPLEVVESSVTDLDGTVLASIVCGPSGTPGGGARSRRVEARSVPCADANGR